jgi:hypothetical protein|tara:strand:+ start:13850 stop:14398 length:549 start_codon:yes stop_codon:yes gene_type:complete
MGISSIHMSDCSYNYIVKNLDKGKTILELGSGYGTTVRLSEHFTMISVENQPEWQNKFSENSKYINVGNKNYDKGETTWWDKDSEKFEVYDGFEKYDTGWYNPDELLPQLPSKDKYNMIIIDGPGGWLGRSGFLKYIDYFNTNVPILVDDIQREQEFLLLQKISEKVNRKYTILEDKCTGLV